MSNKSMQDYIGTLNGKKPSGIKSYEELTAACFCYHYVIYSEKRVPTCEFNGEELCCPTCKSFKLYGICSHICAVNHLLENCDLDDALKELAAPRKKGGFRQGVRPALVREREVASDSSEDEPLSRRITNKKPKVAGLQMPS